MVRTYALFIFLSALFVSIQAQENVANIPNLGQVQYSILKSFEGQDIMAFRGIKYANAKRFAPSELFHTWTGIYNATIDGSICPQPTRYLHYPEMDEDCLFLNIYTRDLLHKKPVLVHIHGGGNFRGMSHSSEIGPQYILDKDIVLVTINYRLGAFGFLSTQTAEAPGNNGYKDQAVALKWVRRFIEGFGGDPQSITLSGRSAGGMAVTLHLLSPMSRGLFQKAIVMSGATTHHYHVDNVQWTQELAHGLGCPKYDPKLLVDCLKTKPWKAIIDLCSTWEVYGLSNMKWNYEIEKDFGQEVFLTGNPTELFKQGEFKRVPIMTGLSRDEFKYSVLRKYHLLFVLLTLQMLLYIISKRNLSHNDVYIHLFQDKCSLQLPSPYIISLDNLFTLLMILPLLSFGDKPLGSLLQINLIKFNYTFRLAIHEWFN